MKPYELSLSAAARAIATKELSPVELTESVLRRSEATEPSLNAYVTVLADTARESALHAEQEIQAGRYRGSLHGIPVALKDVIDSAGTPTTACSRVWADRTPTEDSAVAERLAAAGTVLMGKTHTHEFAYGLITPQTVNPWDTSRMAGGSSGGSAVAVAAGSATFALGTDTGGSVRVPSALNGVVGLKPTFGLISRHGTAPLAWSLDHIGTLTRSAQDAALVLDALAGHDPRDPASIASPNKHSECALSGDLRGLRIGIPRNYFFEKVDAHVEQVVRTAIDHLGDLGATIVGIEVPLANYLLATQWGLMGAEAASVHEGTLRASPDLYTQDVRALLEAGQLITAGDYLRAQRSRTLIRNSWLRMFDDIDVIAAPSVPCTALGREQTKVHWPDGSTETATDAYVRLAAPANVTGFPALSLPVGYDDGLPIGMQLIARPLAEPELLRTGIAYENTHKVSGQLAIDI
ncbi:amidase [Streptomyces sp. NPDC051561]|uniref:amidase n=1 Tax=Streptomyces sp. NPDC051561 TaxID=3365658 RepID=UPI0037A2CB9D